MFEGNYERSRRTQWGNDGNDIDRFDYLRKLSMQSQRLFRGWREILLGSENSQESKVPIEPPPALFDKNDH